MYNFKTVNETLRMIDTAIIVVNWNGKHLLEDCFDSLVNQGYKNFKVIFVDNGSEDGSAEFVEENYLRRGTLAIEIIRLEKNTGFCYANNLGIGQALEDKNIRWILILNNDTKLADNFFSEILQCAARHKNVGSLQPKIVNFYRQNVIDCAGIMISYDGVSTNRGFGKDESKFNEEEEVFGANGTAGIFARDALEATKIKDGEYFDNDYFAYYEDADLAWRMRLSGFKSYYCPQAKIFHIHSATAKRISGLKAYYLNRNHFYVIFKNFPPKYLALALLLTPFRYLIAPFRRANDTTKARKAQKVKKKAGSAKMILKAWLDVFRNISRVSAKRKFVKNHKKVNKREIARWFRKFGVKFMRTF